MKKQSLALPEIKLIGISIRTNNATEVDPCWFQYSSQYLHTIRSLRTEPRLSFTPRCGQRLGITITC